MNLIITIGLKQATLQFKPIKKGTKKKDKDSDESDDIDFGSISPLPQRSSRRAAGINLFLFSKSY